jgi:hypothetical protein
MANANGVSRRHPPWSPPGKPRTEVLKNGISSIKTDRLSEPDAKAGRAPKQNQRIIRIAAANRGKIIFSMQTPQNNAVIGVDVS